ncbi:hypothetical protein CRYUN_Cryun27aG0101800 [Craigia yunnanensis]
MVHITQGDHLEKGVIVSWVTPDEPGSNLVLYWAENNAEGIVLTYKYFNYTSGYIHHCTIKNLEMPYHFTTTPDGILGEGLWREMLHINPGYGPQEIMKLILFLKYSYVHHHIEEESMRVVYEPWLVEYKVDVVFAGDECILNIAYNVVNGLCTPTMDPSASVYITIGDRVCKLVSRFVSLNQNFLCDYHRNTVGLIEQDDGASAKLLSLSRSQIMEY